ncbi:MAG: hypothetical protein DRG25_03685 [Deltaproteobacteria bacterium]|nr:MAG: hypothetical protein DRG25_03685 [Deltaproteobacteria bacterium]
MRKQNLNAIFWSWLYPWKPQTMILVIMLITLPAWSYGKDTKPKSSINRLISISLAYQDRVADAALIVAIHKGFFEAEGLKLKKMRFSNGPACSEALLLGNADFGTMGDATAIIAAARGAPIKIIASHGGGERRHRIIVNKKSNVRIIADLEGKKLAIKKGTSTYGGLLIFAERHKLNLSKVHIIDMKPIDMVEAMLSGSVDAIVASEPTPSLIEFTSQGQELATLAGLGSNYPILLVVRSKFALKNPVGVHKVLKAIRKGAQYISENIDSSAEILSQVTGLPIKVAKKSMGYHYYRRGMDDKVIDSLKTTASFLMRQGVIDKIPDLAKVIDKGYLCKIE